MSTTRCVHGAVISDTMGVYRCDECDPHGVIEGLREAARAVVDAWDGYDVIDRQYALEQAVFRLRELVGDDS